MHYNMDETKWIIFSFILFPLFFAVSDSCLKNPQPAPPTVPTPSQLVYLSTIPNSHRLSCTAQETQSARCINGGSCFAVAMSSSGRKAYCSCSSDWTGERCQIRYVDPSYWAVQSADAGTYNVGGIIGIVIAVIVVLVAVVIFAIWFRRKQVREGRPKLNQPLDQQKIIPNEGGVVLRNGNTPNNVGQNGKSARHDNNHDSRDSPGRTNKNYNMTPSQSNNSSLGRKVGDSNRSPSPLSVPTFCSTVSSTYSVAPLTVHETSC